MKQKAVFKNIFFITIILLTVLPVLVTFSALLTAVFSNLHWYVWLQNVVVPFESRLVAVILKAFGITAILTPHQTDVSLLVKKSNEYLPVVLQWNCLGWQSILLLFITFITGLRGNHTLVSKIETIVFGIIGTFLINLLRMAFIIIAGFYWNRIAVLIVHDYFAVFISLIWMLFFWWFSYTYILEDKRA